MLTSLASIALLLQLAAAHFAIQYPYWRGDSFATQYTRPCGGVNQSASNGNRTLWPIDGGALSFTPGHPWAITYVNLGLGGDNTTTFPIVLVPGFNQTGNGTFCWPKVPVPANLNITDGQPASIQVIQISETGSSLYNCADITFSKNATKFNSCTNSTGVSGKTFQPAAATCPASNASSSATPKSSSATSVYVYSPYYVVVAFIASALAMFA